MEAWRKFRSDLNLSEISGSFGDLGTFLPLLVGLVRTCDLDLGTSLIFTGAYNVATGLLFDNPMPVQPMKAIAAVAVAEPGLRIPEIMAAGVFVSTTSFLLGATNLVAAIDRLIPPAVVRGIQLAVGLQLAEKGFSLVWFLGTSRRPVTGSEYILPGLFAAAFILLALFSGGEVQSRSTEDRLLGAGLSSEEESGSGRQRQLWRGAAVGRGNAGRGSHASLNHWLVEEGVPESPDQHSAHSPTMAGLDLKAGAQPRKQALQIPAALVIVAIGVIWTLIRHSHVLRTLRLGPTLPQLVFPDHKQWLAGIVDAGLPQLPLTVLNSIVAVCQLSADKFPDRPASPRRVALSVGVMNLIGPWFGALPCCHGAGGLAAQARFGAQTGAAPIFLGLVKIALGVLFGSSLFQLLQAFPMPLLGALLIFAGVELASSCQAQSGQPGMTLMLLTAAAIVALKNTGLGFLAGLAAACLLAVSDACWQVASGWASPHRYQRQGNLPISIGGDETLQAGQEQRG